MRMAVVPLFDLLPTQFGFRFDLRNNVALHREHNIGLICRTRKLEPESDKTSRRYGFKIAAKNCHCI